MNPDEREVRADCGHSCAPDDVAGGMCPACREDYERGCDVDERIAEHDSWAGADEAWDALKDERSVAS